MLAHNDIKNLYQKALVGMLSSLLENVGSLLYGTKSFWKAMTQDMWGLYYKGAGWVEDELTLKCHAPSYCQEFVICLTF